MESACLKKTMNIAFHKDCNQNKLPFLACNLFHDSRLTKSMADKLYFAQQNDPMYPNEYQHHCTCICQHMKDLQQIKLSVLRSAGNAPQWNENYMFAPNHLNNKESFTNRS